MAQGNVENFAIIVLVNGRTSEGAQVEAMLAAKLNIEITEQGMTQDGLRA